MIGGAGRLAALTAISATAYQPAGHDRHRRRPGGRRRAARRRRRRLRQHGHHRVHRRPRDRREDDRQAAASVNSRVFAIGLGTADQLNPGALVDIANGTGGYLLLTGNPGPDDQLLLQKYFAQVLAGATNAAIVVDPDGFVPVGGKAVVPFDLTDADIRADVLVLGEMAPVFRVEIIAPDGTSITAGAGADETVRRGLPGAAGRALRRPARRPPAAGQWQAVLSVDDAEAQVVAVAAAQALRRQTERGAPALRPTRATRSPPTGSRSPSASRPAAP